MKKLIYLIAVVCLRVPVFAQNLATVSASNITDLNQNKLAAGQLCFLATDQSDNAISFNIGGGGQVLKRAFCATVTNGAVTQFTVPNPANTQPVGIYYRITVKDTSTGQEVLRYTQVAFAGTTFNFDNYAPTFPSYVPPMSNATVGNLNINGNLSVTGSMSFMPSAFTASNATINQAANGNDAIFGKRATDTSPSGNFQHFRNFANTADLWTVDATGTLQSGTVPTARLSGTFSGAQLPNPTSTTLGGVESLAAVAHQWINSISTAGVPAASQPSFADLSGTVAASQLPNPSATSLGGVQSFAAVAHQWINSISTSGVPTASQPGASDLSNGATGSGTVVLSTSPSITTPTLTSPTLVTPNIGAATGTTINATTGFQLNGLAPSANVLRGNGTNFVSAQLAAADLSNGATGSGSVVLANSPSLTTPNIGAAIGSTHTFVNQAAPANPAAGSIVIYDDILTGNLTCRNSSGGSCLTATASAPLISTSTNPALTGVLRAASGDTAIAFRNSANTADIAALFKTLGDIVVVGGSAGISTVGPVMISSTDTGVSRTAAATIAVGNGTAGDTSGTLKALAITSNTHTLVNQAAPANPATGSIVIYDDILTGNLTCRNSSGGSCFTATASAPLISTSTNPALTGVLRAASGDTAIAFRNAANTADIPGLSKNASDQVSIGGSAGITAGSATFAGTGAGTGTTVALSVSGNSATTGGMQVFTGQVGVNASEKLRIEPADGSVRFSIIGLSSLTTGTLNAPDTGLSRTAAATIAVGNGTQGDASGTLKVTALNNGGTLSLPASTDTLVGRGTTDTLTNKTIDAEASGNSITLPNKIWYQAAGCQNSAPTAYWDMGTSSIPTAVCVNGANVIKGLLRYTANGQAAQVHYQMPADTKASGTVDINLIWTTGTASGTAQWAVDSTCTSIGSTDDPAWTALWAPATSTASATVNATNSASIAGLTAPCSAGQIMHLRLRRVDTAGTATNADVFGVEITYRRTE